MLMVIINGGLGFNSKGFQVLVEFFSEDYQAILYDQWGMGWFKMEKIIVDNMMMDLMVADFEVLCIYFGLE